MGNHNVDRYSFKSLSSDDEPLTQKQVEHRSFISKDEEVDTTLLTQSSKDSLIESLLKKTDEMSSNFIKLQMKLESMSEEHKNELTIVKKESYDNGFKDGKEQSQKDDTLRVTQTIEQFAISVSKLDNFIVSMQNSLDEIKKELSSVALDIAKEVIKVEVDTNSNNIALKLSTDIIAQLKEATSITLRVNSNDYEFLSNKLSTLSNVKIIPDSAITKGGVVATSDGGNIDAQILKRFDRVKKMALGE